MAASDWVKWSLETTKKWPFTAAGIGFGLIGFTWVGLLLVLAYPWLLCFVASCSSFAYAGSAYIWEEGLLVLSPAVDKALQRTTFELLRDVVLWSNRVVSDWFRLVLLAEAELNTEQFQQVLEELDRDFKYNVFTHPAVELLPGWVKLLLHGRRGRSPPDPTTREASARVLMRQAPEEPALASESGDVTPTPSEPPSARSPEPAVPMRPPRVPFLNLASIQRPAVDSDEEEEEVAQEKEQEEGAQPQEDASPAGETSPPRKGLQGLKTFQEKVKTMLPEGKSVSFAQSNSPTDNLGLLSAPSAPAPAPAERLKVWPADGAEVVDLENKVGITPREVQKSRSREFNKFVATEIYRYNVARQRSKRTRALRIANEKASGFAFEQFKDASMVHLEPIMASAYTIAMETSQTVGKVVHTVTAPLRLAYAGVTFPFRVPFRVGSAVLRIAAKAKEALPEDPLRTCAEKCVKLMQEAAKARAARASAANTLQDGEAPAAASALQGEEEAEAASAKQNEEEAPEAANSLQEEEALQDGEEAPEAARALQEKNTPEAANSLQAPEAASRLQEKEEAPGEATVLQGDEETPEAASTLQEEEEASEAASSLQDEEEPPEAVGTLQDEEEAPEAEGTQQNDEAADAQGETPKAASALQDEEAPEAANTVQEKEAPAAASALPNEEAPAAASALHNEEAPAAASALQNEEEAPSQ